MLDRTRMRNAEAAKRIQECAIDLLHRAPLFGLTLLGTAIRVEEAHNVACTTMMTDGRKIWYAAEWVLKKPRPSIMFDLLHETLHVFHNHPARRGMRDPRIWGYAVDVRVAHDGLAICHARGTWRLDEDHVPDHAWAKYLTAEEIYNALLKDPEKVPAEYQPDTLIAPEAVDNDEQEFKRKLTQDLLQAKLAEESMGGTIKELYGEVIYDRLQELARCEVPWQQLLQGRLAAALGHEVATWVPPNRRWFPVIPMPSRRGTQEDELLLGIDISGSISDDDLRRFRGAIMPAARRAKKTTVVTFDAEVRECSTSTRPEELLRAIRFKTGNHSHTDVRGVFEEVDKRRPSAVAIITDGYVAYPEKAYSATHWILTPGGAKPPWGMIYRLQTSW